MASVTKTEGVSAGWRLLGYSLEAATMFLAAGISLFILVYVGFGDGKRNYEQIQLEQVSAQGALVQNSIEKFVRDGLPLKQYAGFSTVAASIIEREEVDALAVY